MRISDWSSDVCSSDLAPCGVASRFLGITQVRVPRLAWRLAGCHHTDAISVNRPYEELSMRSVEHPSELQSLMRISYAVFCLNKKSHHLLHTPTLLPHFLCHLFLHIHLPFMLAMTILL